MFKKLNKMSHKNTDIGIFNLTFFQVLELCERVGNAVPDFPVVSRLSLLASLYTLSFVNGMGLYQS